MELEGFTLVHNKLKEVNENMELKYNVFLALKMFKTMHNVLIICIFHELFEDYLYLRGSLWILMELETKNPVA